MLHAPLVINTQFGKTNIKLGNFSLLGINLQVTLRPPNPDVLFRKKKTKGIT